MYEAVWFDRDYQSMLLAEKDGVFSDGVAATFVLPNGKWVDYLENGDVFVRLTVIGEL